MKFEWDDAKDRSNQRKHGTSFSEAKELFEEIFDSAHLDMEDRFIAIGEIHRGTVFTEREEETVRIIGARFATKREQERYHAYLDQNI